MRQNDLLFCDDNDDNDDNDDDDTKLLILFSFHLRIIRPVMTLLITVIQITGSSLEKK